MIKEIANIIVKPVGTLEAVLWLAHVGFTMEGFAFVLSNISGNDGDINGGVHLVLVIATLVAVRLIAGRYSDRHTGRKLGFTPMTSELLIEVGFDDFYSDESVLQKQVPRTQLFVVKCIDRCTLDLQDSSGVFYTEITSVQSMEELNSFWRMMTGEWLCKDKFK